MQTAEGSSKPVLFGRACHTCRKDHKACDSKRPCGRCMSMGIGDSCHSVPLQKRGRPVKNRDATDEEERQPKRRAQRALKRKDYLPESSIFGPFVPHQTSPPSPSSSSSPSLSQQPALASVLGDIMRSLNDLSNLTKELKQEQDSIRQALNGANSRQLEQQHFYNNYVQQQAALQIDEPQRHHHQEPEQHDYNSQVQRYYNHSQQPLDYYTVQQYFSDRSSLESMHMPTLDEELNSTPSYEFDVPVLNEPAFFSPVNGGKKKKDAGLGMLPFRPTLSLFHLASLVPAEYYSRMMAVAFNSELPFILEDTDKPFSIMVPEFNVPTTLECPMPFRIHRKKVSPAWCQLLNFTEDELLADSKLGISKEQKCQFFPIIQHLFTISSQPASPIVEISPKFVRRDGTHIAASSRFQVFYDETGFAVFFVCLIHQITDVSRNRKLAVLTTEQEEHHFDETMVKNFCIEVAKYRSNPSSASPSSPSSSSNDCIQMSTSNVTDVSLLDTQYNDDAWKAPQSPWNFESMLQNEEVLLQ